MKVHIYFRQDGAMGTSTRVALGRLRNVHKEIELAAVPYPGSLFEYEDGWALVEVGDKLRLEIAKDSISISGYGPQFTQEELYLLEELGWEIS